MSIKEWGNATWYLFHTLAEKLKPEHAGECQALVSQFAGICRNLPCPDCRGHATATIRAANIHLVRNRESLKLFLFELHNKVNTRLGKPQYSKEELNNRYACARTYNVVGHFTTVFSQNANNSKGMLDAIQRQRCVGSFIKYIQANGHKFNG